MFDINRNTINNNIKTRAVSFRCSIDEQIFLEKKSLKFNKKRSDFIREAILYYSKYKENNKLA